MENRIQKIKETYSERLVKKLKEEKVDISLDSAWDIMISADPSPNKKNMRWLVDIYLNNGFLWEDIALGPASKVSETLTEFNKHKRNLEPSDRSLTKYRTLGSLWSSIKPYVGQLTAGEEKREEREKAYNECEVIVDREDGFRIISPLTEYAAKWFGRGTRWCTASENDNMFYQYASDAPLFIILMPNGDKLQLWKCDDRVQFMDENDVSVTSAYIDEHGEHLDCLESLIGHLLSRNWETEESCIRTLTNEPSLFPFMPSSKLTPKILRATLKAGYKSTDLFKGAGLSNFDFMDEIKKYMLEEKDFYFIKHVLYALEDQTWLQDVINQNPEIYAFLSPNFQSVEISRKALSMDESMWKHVPDKIRKLFPEYWHLNSKYNVLWVEKKLSKKEWHNRVMQNNDLFMIMPDKYKTHELCEHVFKTNPARNIFYVIPDACKTSTMIDYMISKDNIAIMMTPRNLLERKHFFLVAERSQPLESEVSFDAFRRLLFANTDDPETLKNNILTRVFALSPIRTHLFSHADYIHLINMFTASRQQLFPSSNMSILSEQTMRQIRNFGNITLEKEEMEQIWNKYPNIQSNMKNGIEELKNKIKDYENNSGLSFQR